jgi:hypothetical protein
MANTPVYTVSRARRQSNINTGGNIIKRNIIRNAAETSRFGFVIGHGVSVGTKFDVPPNVHVIFLSDPGYPLSVGVVDNKFPSLVKNLSKFKNFIRGTLPENQIPRQLLARNWKWWEHVYQPNSKCPNLKIELFDRTHPNLDVIMGLWYSGQGGVVPFHNSSNSSGRKFHGRTMNLKELSEAASINTRNHGGCFLFVTSCRGTSDVSRPIVNGGATGMQNYPLEPFYNVRSNILAANRRAEEIAARLATRKRMRGSVPFSSEKRFAASRQRRNNNSLNNVITRMGTPISRHLNMINQIRNANNINVQLARARYPNFFRNISNANANTIIKSIKNGRTNKNNVSNLISSRNYGNYKVNSGTVRTRIVARLRNLGII